MRRNDFLIDIIAGARPNFIKISPIIRELKKRAINDYLLKFRLIHTGQHYDRNMSGNFFEQLNIPEPDFNLEVGSGTQANQTAGIMLSYEKILIENPSNLCLVVGDVTSTMACAITAKKLNIDVAHVEGGIRSGDRTMPEEINRLVTDSITDYFFTTTLIANENLIKEGHNAERIYFVGNTMIDTLLFYENRFIQPNLWKENNLNEGNYLILTLHRPSNVDQQEILRNIILEILKQSDNFPIIFPVHPRTRNNLIKIGIDNKRLIYVDPLSYLEFNYLVKNSFAVITDSGGITEETTVMGIPCMTLRDSTERPETITIGTNELVGTNPNNIAKSLSKLLSGNWKKGAIPEKWDGQTSKRIVDHLENIAR